MWINGFSCNIYSPREQKQGGRKFSENGSRTSTTAKKNWQPLKVAKKCHRTHSKNRKLEKNLAKVYGFIKSETNQRYFFTRSFQNMAKAWECQQHRAVALWQSRVVADNEKCCRYSNVAYHWVISMQSDFARKEDNCSEKMLNCTLLS